MFTANSNAVSDCRCGKVLTCSHKMFDFVKNPGISYCCAPYHNSIYTIPVFVFNSLLRRIDITVSEYRNLDPWIVFNLSNKGPVGFPFVHLGTSTSMYSQRFNANILKSLGNLLDIPG